MIDVTARTRVVIVLGSEHPIPDPAAFIEEASRREVPVLVLSVGFPTSPVHRSFVERAIEDAFRHHVLLTAARVTGPAGLGAELAQGDQVTVLARGRERRRIERALRRLRG